MEEKLEEQINRFKDIIVRNLQKLQERKDLAKKEIEIIKRLIKITKKKI